MLGRWGFSLLSCSVTLDKPLKLSGPFIIRSVLLWETQRIIHIPYLPTQCGKDSEVRQTWPRALILLHMLCDLEDRRSFHRRTWKPEIIQSLLHCRE